MYSAQDYQLYPGLVVNYRTEFSVGLATFALYAIVYTLGHEVLFGRRDWFRTMEKSRRHEITSYLVSLVNSTLHSAAVLYLFYMYRFNPARFWPFIRLWVVWFATYTLYDTVSCSMVDFHVFRSEPGLVIHHVVVFGFFVYSLYCPPEIMYFCMIAGVCEVNSIFLHIRTLMKLGVPGLAPYRWVNEYCNAVTYIIFRYATCLLSLYRSLALLSTVSNIYWVIGCSVYCGINTIYGYRLIRGYMKQWRRRFDAAAKTAKTESLREAMQQPASEQSFSTSASETESTTDRTATAAALAHLHTRKYSVDAYTPGPLPIPIEATVLAEPSRRHSSAGKVD